MFNLLSECVGLGVFLHFSKYDLQDLMLPEVLTYGLALMSSSFSWCFLKSTSCYLKQELEILPLD